MDPNRLWIKSDDTTLYKFQRSGLWKDRLSGKNYDDHEMLRRLLVIALTAPNLTVVPLPNDMFFDDDEKLYYQENFVKRREVKTQISTIPIDI